MAQDAARSRCVSIRFACQLFAASESCYRYQSQLNEENAAIGSDCALKSDNSSRQVPVQTLLTLPENIVDEKIGSTVSKTKLFVDKGLSQNIFQTKSFGQNQKGSIDLLVNQRDVDTMLQSRADTYRGAVTVIFDSHIH